MFFLKAAVLQVTPGWDLIWNNNIRYQKETNEKNIANERLNEYRALLLLQKPYITIKNNPLKISGFTPCSCNLLFSTVS